MRPATAECLAVVIWPCLGESWGITQQKKMEMIKGQANENGVWLHIVFLVCCCFVFVFVLVFVLVLSCLVCLFV